MSEPRPLHRLFSLSWIDIFEGTDIGASTEIDMSLKQRILSSLLDPNLAYILFAVGMMAL